MNAKLSWQGVSSYNRVSLIPIDIFATAPAPERLHLRVAHVRVRVIEPRNEGGAVLRERRRLQLSGRLHSRLANVLVRVLAINKLLRLLPAERAKALGGRTIEEVISAYAFHSF